MLRELPCAGEDVVVPRVTQRKFISSSNLRPENMLRAICYDNLNPVSTLVPPVSFGNILDDRFVISDPHLTTVAPNWLRSLHESCSHGTK